MRTEAADEERFLGRGYARCFDAKERAIYIGNLPGRKQVCLYAVDSGVLDVLAYFKTHEKAQKALDWLDDLVGVEDTGEGAARDA